MELNDGHVKLQDKFTLILIYVFFLSFFLSYAFGH